MSEATQRVKSNRLEFELIIAPPLYINGVHHGGFHYYAHYKTVIFTIYLN